MVGSLVVGAVGLWKEERGSRFIGYSGLGVEGFLVGGLIWGGELN